MESVLVVGESVLFDSLVFLGHVLTQGVIFLIKLLHLNLKFFLKLFDHNIFLVNFFVFLLVELLVNFDHLFVKLSTAEFALLDLTLKHVLLTVLIIEEQVFDTLHFVLELVHHVFGVLLLLAVSNQTLLEALAAVISRLNLHL